MPDYRRYRVPGGTYFFTVNLLERFPYDLLVRHIERLRAVVRGVRAKRPFHMDAWHLARLHCVLTLPPGDDDFTHRWRLVKQGFSKALPVTERRLPRPWRARSLATAVWEHTIREDAEHMEYCPINPVKHGYFQRVADCLHSTFHPFVERGVYPLNWANKPTGEVETGERD